MIRGEFRLVARVAAAGECSCASVEAEVLRHLRRVGFDGVPVAVPMPRSGGRDGPSPREAGSERALRAMARLLRRFHDAMAAFPGARDVGRCGREPYGREPYGREPYGREPYGCVPYGLGGVTPHDVVFSGGVPRRLVSLRGLAPSPRVVDVALTLLHWAPVRDPAARPVGQRWLDPGPRLAGFCDAYGLGTQPRRAVLPAIRDHLLAGSDGTAPVWLEANWDRLDAYLR